MYGAGRHSAAEVFAAFLKLGMTSFGGPIAHLGYFHRELVARRGWVSEEQYAHLLALCQFLPGPASSQLGFALGLIRAGWLGALAAFMAFTLPSAVLLVAFAGAADFLEGTYGHAAIQGLKLVAVAVVADGIRQMARRLTPDTPRLSIAAAAAAVIVISNSPWNQLAVVAAGAVLGQWLCRTISVQGAVFPLRYASRTSALLLVAFGVLLGFALITAQGGPAALASVAAGFYRAGALVFGGGHVVLPLLEQAVVEPGWVATEEFLAGYGAAQAVPGPMFTLAAFLGARMEGIHALVGASVCTLAIFLPGLLLVSGALPWWRSIGSHPGATRAIAGVNAAVVGLLAAALYDPVWTSAVGAPSDAVIALIGFALLAVMRASTLAVLGWCVGASLIRAALPLGS